jgi:hypothetical protein
MVVSSYQQSIPVEIEIETETSRAQSKHVKAFSGSRLWRVPTVGRQRQDLGGKKVSVKNVETSKPTQK